MKKKFDIYKIDNVLIKIGYFFLILFLSTAYRQFKIFQSQGFLEFDNIAAPLFLAGGTFGLLWTGYYYRIIENRINSILKILTITSEASVNEIQQNTGFTRSQIESAIITINQKLPFYFVLNKNSDTISDGRLKTKLARVDSCTSCGKPINQDFPVSSDTAPVCPNCGIPLQIDKWNSIKREAIIHIQNGDPLRQSGPSSVFTPADMSWPLFILLLIFFWPAALVYFIVKYRGLLFTKF